MTGRQHKQTGETTMATATIPREPMEEIPITFPAVPPEIESKLKAPLPQEAIGPNPKHKNLSSIKAAFVIERLNDAFGIGGWRDTVREIAMSTRLEVWGKGSEKERAVTLQVATVHLTFFVEKYGIHKENFGGSDNEDLGDALKGARTDALTKIASELGIGLDVYKGGREATPHALPACPNCGKQLRKSKEVDEFYCWTKKDGCGATFTPEGLKAAMDAKSGKKPPAAVKPASAINGQANGVEKITISAKITNIQMDKESQVLHAQVGERDCVSRTLEIWNRFAGKKGHVAELLVSEIKRQNQPSVWQIHKVISIMSEREAAGHDTI
jgi:hypothetical protein